MSLQGGEKDFLINFAKLTKRDGAFIVSRKKIKNFKLSDLKGKTTIGGRKGGMPEMTFEWALKNNNIDPKKFSPYLIRNKISLIKTYSSAMMISKEENDDENCNVDGYADCPLHDGRQSTWR